MRVYLYAGPSKRLDADWFFVWLALNRLPGIEAYLFECHGTTSFHGQRDLTLVMDHDLELFGEERPSWQPPRPFTFITSRGEEDDPFWTGAERIVRLSPAAEPLLWNQETTAEMKWDVGQYGRLDDDVEALDRVFHAFPSFSLDGGQILEQAVDRLKSCRVIHVDDDPRHLMEALCLGKPVVARKQDWHDRLGLESGMHYWAYETPAEAVEVTTLTLANEHVAEGLGRKARDMVTENNTWMHCVCEEVMGWELHPSMVMIPLNVMSDRDRELGMPLLPVQP